MDIFIVLESSELSEKQRLVWDLHYKEGRTAWDDSIGELGISERDRYRKKKEVSQFIVNFWHESWESVW
mgnify:CR=1 FL=1